MDENNRTDKDIIIKGVKKLGISLLCMFAGPSLSYIALSNKDKSLYIPLLIASIGICIAAIILLYIGINTILKSMFKK